jgi:hypothetical protein
MPHLDYGCIRIDTEAHAYAHTNAHTFKFTYTHAGIESTTPIRHADRPTYSYDRLNRAIVELTEP